MTNALAPRRMTGLFVRNLLALLAVTAIFGLRAMEIKAGAPQATALAQGPLAPHR
jgi:hypothetical protein